MVKCEKCGYENNDGCEICLNCRERLAAGNRPLSDPERYIYTNQEAIARVEEKTEKIRKTTFTVLAVSAIAFAVAFAVFLVNLYKPVIDERLIGSWQQRGIGSVASVWTFERDGSCKLNFPGVDYTDSNMYWRAENGVLKISGSPKANSHAFTAYEYYFGVTGDGIECLILESAAGEMEHILYKVT